MGSNWTAYYDSIHKQILVIKHTEFDEEGFPTDSQVVFSIEGDDLMNYASEEDLKEHVKENHSDVLIDLGLEG